MISNQTNRTGELEASRRINLERLIPNGNGPRAIRIGYLFGERGYYRDFMLHVTIQYT